jgi:AraC family ethanolamine operon transcriptional activator
MARDAVSRPETAQAVVEELIGTFVGIAVRSDSPKPRGRPRVSRGRIVSRVREFLDSPSRSPRPVAEMARCTRVSERTLRKALHEQFGVSPKRLLIPRQLRDVRNALLLASAEETVSRIATRHGVWELGRFARRYRELFGEKPSTTLAAAHAAAPRRRSEAIA